MILPVLNGMLHLDILASHFGAEHVLGGQSKISATLDDEGRIHHLSSFHSISFGEQNGTRTPRIEALADTLHASGFDAHAERKYPCRNVEQMGTSSPRPRASAA